MIDLFRAFPIFVPACLISIIFTMLASRNRTEKGKNARFTPLYRRDRDHFTDIGWRYRRYSVILTYVAAVSVIIPELLKLWQARG
jgi:hypothetical protein